MQKKKFYKNANMEIAVCNYKEPSIDCIVLGIRNALHHSIIVIVVIKRDDYLLLTLGVGCYRHSIVVIPQTGPRESWSVSAWVWSRWCMSSLYDEDVYTSVSYLSCHRCGNPNMDLSTSHLQPARFWLSVPSLYPDLIVWTPWPHNLP